MQWISNIISKYRRFFFDLFDLCVTQNNDTKWIYRMKDVKISMYLNKFNSIRMLIAKRLLQIPAKGNVTDARIPWKSLVFVTNAIRSVKNNRFSCVLFSIRRPKTTGQTAWNLFIVDSVYVIMTVSNANHLFDCCYAIFFVSTTYIITLDRFLSHVHVLVLYHRCRRRFLSRNGCSAK